MSVWDDGFRCAERRGQRDFDGVGLVFSRVPSESLTYFATMLNIDWMFCSQVLVRPAAFFPESG